MDELQIRVFRAEDESAVIELWEACGLTRSWNDPQKDIQRKTAEQPELFFVAEIEGRLVGVCMAGYDGHRGSICYLGVHPDFQRRDVARRLMRHSETVLKARGCPKINLMVRRTNQAVHEFYERIGYREDPVTVRSLRLIEDEPPGTDSLGVDERL